VLQGVNKRVRQTRGVTGSSGSLAAWPKWGNLGLFFLELQFALGFTSELPVIRQDQPRATSDPSAFVRRHLDFSEALCGPRYDRLDCHRERSGRGYPVPPGAETEEGHVLIPVYAVGLFLADCFVLRLRGVSLVVP